MRWAEILILIVGALLLTAIAVYAVINQRNKVIEWLKYAVSEAEKQLGGGTGQLKLRLCYDRFVEKFPVVAAVVPFRVFSTWVDAALGTMKEWLKSNSNVANYVQK